MLNLPGTRVPAEPTWYVDSSPEPEELISPAASIPVDAPPSTPKARKSLPSPPPSQTVPASTPSPTASSSAANANAPTTPRALREPPPPSPATQRRLDFEASDKAAFLRVLNMAPDPYAMSAEEREEMRLEGEAWAERERLGLNQIDQDHPEKEVEEEEWEESEGTVDGGDVSPISSRGIGFGTPPPNAGEPGSPIRPGPEDVSPITTATPSGAASSCAGSPAVGAGKRRRLM